MAETYTYDDISKALNRAADDVLEAANAPDTGVRDAINLVVNATVGYLTGAAGTLAEVVETHYDEATLDEVLDWIHG